jgi:hypothetical protein
MKTNDFKGDVMMKTTYKVFFNVKNLGLYGKIPGLKEAMQSELVRVYNVYADKTNAGITEKLNEEFAKLYPNYHRDNQDKEWYDLTEYNRFMAEGYQRLVVDELNNSNASQILDFFVDPDEVAFKGCLKADRNVIIDFYLQ